RPARVCNGNGGNRRSGSPPRSLLGRGGPALSGASRPHIAPTGPNEDCHMNELKIEDRTIGPNAPPCVIAELGVNHDGSVQRALELVTAAAGCGADAVKLQIFRATILLHASAGLAEYQKNTRAESPIDLLRKFELPADDVRRVVQRIRELKMIPLATPFSPADVEMVEQLRIPAIKIASPDLVNRPLLERAAATRKPLLISTGGATIEEVETTVGWLNQW